MPSTAPTTGPRPRNELSNGESAVVLKAHAPDPDPYRPCVHILMESDELPLAHPTELNLWELTEENDNAIQAPLGIQHRSGCYNFEQCSRVNA
jgi:hypothetical protein